MAPTSDGLVPRTREEKEFLAAAEKSGKMPSAPNRKKAREAYNRLPKNSPFRHYKFEG